MDITFLDPLRYREENKDLDRDVWRELLSRHVEYCAKLVYILADKTDKDSYVRYVNFLKENKDSELTHYEVILKGTVDKDKNKEQAEVYTMYKEMQDDRERRSSSHVRVYTTEEDGDEFILVTDLYTFLNDDRLNSLWTEEDFLCPYSKKDMSYAQFILWSGAYCRVTLEFDIIVDKVVASLFRDSWFGFANSMLNNTNKMCQEDGERIHDILMNELPIDR